MTNIPRTSTLLTVVFATTMLIHLALIGFSLPLSAAFNGWISWGVDNPYHVYQIELGRALLKEGLLTGYDPFFGGGYVGGVTYNISARFPVLISALLPENFSTAHLYTLYVLCCSIVAPAAIIGMARLMRWPVVHTAIGALMGLAMWWLGAIRWYYTAGMVSFVCGAYLALAYSAWIWKICSDKEDQGVWWRLALAGVAGGAGLWIHPLFGLIAGAMFLGFVFADLRQSPIARLARRGLIIASVAILLNVPWIIAMMRSQSIVTQSPYQKSVGLAVAVDPLLGIWSTSSMGTFLNPLCVGTCIAGFFLLTREQYRKIAPFVFAGGMLLLFAAFGAASSTLATLQPNRFVAPAFLVFALGAAYCAGSLVTWFPAHGNTSIKVVTVLVALFVSSYATREIVREVSAGSHGHYGKSPPELSAQPAIVSQLQSWILENTSADGRILFETSLGRVHGGGHVAGMIALNTRREFIGAPYPHSLPELSFWDGVGFGKPNSELTADEFSSGLDLYNVGWIIVHSDDLFTLVDKLLANAHQVAQFGKIRIFKLDRSLSYVYSGTGQVRREFNRVEVTGVRGPEIILRYNWVRGLKASPALHVEPVQVKAGFPPLIRVISPPEQFSLSM